MTTMRDGKFCGAMDPGRHEVDYRAAVPLTGQAGSITIHHVRAVHGSAPNRSSQARRLLLFQFRGGRRVAACWAFRKGSRRMTG